MKKNEIPPTRAREGLGLPSPRDFPRAWRCAPSALGKSLREGKPITSLPFPVFFDVVNNFFPQTEHFTLSLVLSLKALLYVEVDKTKMKVSC